MAKYNKTDLISQQLRFRLPSYSSNHTENDPNKWFADRFPEQVQQYGPAFMEGTWEDAGGLTRHVPACLNEDFFAALLGGNRELGHQVIWFPQEETFYFFDYRHEAFCLTTEEKLKLLVSNYLLRCAQDCKPLVNISNLVIQFRQDDVLQRIVEKAKAVLEADRLFFQGEQGQRRCIDGKFIEPNEEPSYRQFVKRAIVKEPEGKITVADAFHRYFEFCRSQKQQPLTRQEFKQLVGEVIREQFNVGLRHDVPTENGRSGHGWVGVRLETAGVFGKN